MNSSTFIKGAVDFFDKNKEIETVIPGITDEDYIMLFKNDAGAGQQLLVIPVAEFLSAVSLTSPYSEDFAITADDISHLIPLTHSAVGTPYVFREGRRIPTSAYTYTTNNVTINQVYAGEVYTIDYNKVNT